MFDESGLHAGMPQSTPMDAGQMAGWRERFRKRLGGGGSMRGRMAGAIGGIGEMFGGQEMAQLVPMQNFGIMDEYRRPQMYQTPDIMPPRRY